MADFINCYSINDIEYIHQVVYDLRLDELQVVLDTVNEKISANEQSLRNRILDLLTTSTIKNKTLRQAIVKVFTSRSFQRHNTLPIIYDPQAWSINVVNNTVNNGVPIDETSPDLDFEFEHLPFFNTMYTVLEPFILNNSTNDVTSITGEFYLNENNINSIAESKDVFKNEYKIQIILRLAQVGLEENVTERLPYNITVSVNDRQCKLPTLNIPSNAAISPWQRNVPIDITEQTNLRKLFKNKIEITWSGEPHENQYMAGVFVVQKLTWNELVEQLKKRPVRPSDKTKDFVKSRMTCDGEMPVNFIFFSLEDPISKKRLELPARGINCKHLSCFDAIQFLQMNEHVPTWKCPICKEKVKFENLEVDEYFSNILKSPSLSKKCGTLFLLKDGSWTEKLNRQFSDVFILNGQQSPNYEEFTISDSDNEDDMPIMKRAKQDLPKVENPIIESEEHQEEEKSQSVPLIILD